MNEEYIEAARTSLLREIAAVAASVHTSVSESRLLPLSRELRGCTTCNESTIKS